MTDQNAIRVSLSISERELSIVEEEDQRLGLRNFSATIRKIINEWHELTAPTPPGNGNTKERESHERNS